MATGASISVGRLAGGKDLWDCGAGIGSRRGLGRMRRENTAAAWIAAGGFRRLGKTRLPTLECIRRERTALTGGGVVIEITRQRRDFRKAG
jgi:hypothetical protein